jgi:hypothetical protein
MAILFNMVTIDVYLEINSGGSVRCEIAHNTIIMDPTIGTLLFIDSADHFHQRILHGTHTYYMTSRGYAMCQ